MKIYVNVKVIVWTLLFVFTYAWVHTNYLFVYFDYFGYFNKNHSVFEFLFVLLIIILPVLFYRGIVKLSSFVALLFYILNYIPTILTLYFNQNSIFYTSFYLLAFLCSMILLFITDRFNFNYDCLFNNISIKKIQNWSFQLITALITVCLVAKFWGNISFVNFEQIYDLRKQNNELLNGIMGYLILWLSYGFYPVLIVYGIYNKKYFAILGGLLGNILVYGCTGSKASLLMPLIVFAFYLMLNKCDYNKIYLRIIKTITLFSILLFLFHKKLFIFSAVFFMRTLSISGLLNQQYIQFFFDHEYTNYSHINILNGVFKVYPFAQPLGKIIGSYFVSDKLNSNANMWATDGVAALGPIGVFFVTVVLFIVLTFIDSISSKMCLKYKMLMFMPFVFAMLNVSLFTAILSCGLFVLVLYLVFYEIDLSFNR